jgi:hypothetical protein
MSSLTHSSYGLTKTITTFPWRDEPPDKFNDPRLTEKWDLFPIPEYFYIQEPSKHDMFSLVNVWHEFFVKYIPINFGIFRALLPLCPSNRDELEMLALKLIGALWKMVINDQLKYTIDLPYPQTRHGTLVDKEEREYSSAQVVAHRLFVVKKCIEKRVKYSLSTVSISMELPQTLRVSRKFLNRDSAWLLDGFLANTEASHDLADFVLRFERLRPLDVLKITTNNPDKVEDCFISGLEKSESINLPTGAPSVIEVEKPGLSSLLEEFDRPYKKDEKIEDMTLFVIPGNTIESFIRDNKVSDETKIITIKYQNDGIKPKLIKSLVVNQKSFSDSLNGKNLRSLLIASSLGINSPEEIEKVGVQPTYSKGRSLPLLEIENESQPVGAGIAKDQNVLVKIKKKGVNPLKNALGALRNGKLKKFTKIEDFT